MPRVSIEWSTEDRRTNVDGGDDTLTVIGSITFDAVTSQTRDLVSTLPEHPVEGGVAATDHVIPQPRRVSFEAHVSSAVFDLEVSTGASRRATPAGGQDARTIGSSSSEDRAALVLEQLQDLMDAGTEIDVIGLPYGDLEGYQIESISASQDGTSSGKLNPVISIRQRITAAVSEVEAPSPRIERARRQRDRGTQPTTETTETTAPNRSDAAALLDGLTGYFGGSNS